MSSPAPFPPIDGTEACRDADPETFFPKSGVSEDAAPAINTCRRCPFLHECLAYALTHDVDGVWGGTTAAQRSRLRDKHGITVDERLSHQLADIAGAGIKYRIQQMHRGGSPWVTSLRPCA